MNSKRVDRVSRKLQVTVFTTFLSLYVLTMKGIQMRDNVLHYERAQNIVESGALSMPDGRHDPDTDFWSKFFMARGRDGRVYLTLGDGLSLAAVPLVLVGDLLDGAIGARPAEMALQDIDDARHARDSALVDERMRSLRDLPSAFFATLVNPIATALTVLLFFRLCHELTGSSREAFCGSVLLGAGTITWVYSSTFWTQPLVTVCTFGAFYCLCLYRRTSASSLLVLAGTLLGYSFITRYLSILALPFLLLYVVRQQPKKGRALWKSLTLVALPVATFALLQMFWNLYRFGSVLRSGGWHQGYMWASFLGGIHISIPAQLVGLQRSVFVYSPPLLLGVLGMRRFLRTHRLEAEPLLAVIVTYFLIYGQFTLWYAPGSWGPRFLVPITPFMLLPACALLRDRLWKRLLFWGLLSVGIAVQLTCVLLPLQRGAIATYLGGLPEGADHFLKAEIVPQAKVLLSGKVGLWFLDGPIKGAAGAVLAAILISSLAYCVIRIRRESPQRGVGPRPEP